MIIGLTGKNGSGKGEVAKFLTEWGFRYLSLSDVVREEVRRRKKSVTRDNLIQAGNDLRRQYGPGILAERLMGRIGCGSQTVVDSIRHPDEVKTLRRLKDFVLICMTAPAKARFERIRKRKRENDPQTFQEFLRVETIEGKSKVGSDQQLNRTLELADYDLANAGNLSQLHRKTENLIMTIAQSLRRPGWDEYFMEIAKVVALRSNCMKRKVAAVIVKDKRIISTGYNGTPRGVKNCNEGGCPRCNSFAKSGTRLDECLCSHGEENAIVQSAYHGVSINGATIYTTFSPCLLCTKMIINSGLREVVYNVNYPLGGTALKLLKEARIKVRKLKV